VLLTGYVDDSSALSIPVTDVWVTSCLDSKGFPPSFGIEFGENADQASVPVTGQPKSTTLVASRAPVYPKPNTNRRGSSICCN
jgi:hypothetical protein